MKDHFGCWPQVVDTTAAVAEVASMGLLEVRVVRLEVGKLVAEPEVGKFFAGVGRLAQVRLEFMREASEEAATQALEVDKQAFALVVLPYQQQGQDYYQQALVL